MARVIHPAALIGAALLALPASAAAAPDCGDLQPTRTLASGFGVLESVIAAPDGLYFTHSGAGELMRLDAPGAQPRTIATGIEKPGGLLLEPDGTLIVGSGTGIPEGAVGNVAPAAELLRVDPRTGQTTIVASGLAMANGLARGPQGEIYASDDVGTGVDRVVGDRVQHNWATVVSANGLAINAAGTHLYAAQTFQPAAIQSVELANPENVQTYAAADAADFSAGPDGMTIDERDRLFVAANAAGEIWRVDTDRSICAVARGLGMPSAVGFGAGGPFPPEHLYAVTFSGTVVEIPNARPRPAAPAPHVRPARLRPARLRLSVRPRRVRAGRPTTFTFRTESGATVRIGRWTRRADRRGIATVRIRFTRPGLRTVRARLGARTATARFRVTRRG